MPAPILATKLYSPPPRPRVVLRPRLIERLDEGLHRKLILVSAPAGFGKTTLLGGWVAGSDRRVAWLSLDSSAYCSGSSSRAPCWEASWSPRSSFGSCRSASGLSSRDSIHP